jgi:cell division protein FtsB
MQTKIQKYREWIIKHAHQMRDPRTIGLGLFLFVVLMITWSGVKAIDANYGLQREISKLQQQNDVQKLADDNMKLQNDYYNTPQYLEISARRDFGLATKGETVLVVPHNVAMAHTVDLPKPESEIVKQQAKKSGVQRNVESWVEFLLHRQHVQ